MVLLTIDGATVPKPSHNMVPLIPVETLINWNVSQYKYVYSCIIIAFICRPVPILATEEPSILQHFFAHRAVLIRTCISSGVMWVNKLGCW